MPIIGFDNEDVENNLTELKQKAEDAVWCKRNKVDYNGEKLVVSKEQLRTYKQAKKELIDDYLKSMEKRFPEDELLLLHSLSRILNPSRSHIDEDDVTTVKEHYNIDDLANEVEKISLIKQHYNSVDNTSTFAGIILANYSDRFPKLAFLSQIYLALMMASVEAERMFSEMNMTMTKLRNRMSVKRMSHLSLNMGML